MNRMLSTADLFDTYEDRCSSCQIQFKQYGGRRSFAGRIQTVECLGDNALLRRALENHAVGDVLVVDGGGYLGCALIGDMMAGLGLRSGWSGAVVYGAVRDVNALAELDFGIKALGTNPQRSGKNGTGRVNVPVSFGGVTFVPGHWLYSDEDGILVSFEKLEGG